jgi:hypothetical protein
MLVFLLVGHLVPGSTVLPYTSGAFALLHASDGALQWVGQINQFGFIFWLLLALYMLVLAIEQETFARAGRFVAAAMVFEYMCLWSYESAIFIVFLAPPLLLFAIRSKTMARGMALSAIWYLIPAVYVYETYKRYMSVGKTSYQAGVMRQSWSPADVMSDLWVNVRYSVSYWSWLPKESHIRDSEIELLVSGALAVFVLGGAILVCMAVRQKRLLELNLNSRLWRMLAIGVLLLVFSFPAYLALASSTNMFRTQFLSGIGTAMMWGAVLVIASCFVRNKALHAAFILLLSLPFVYTGARRAIEAGGFHRSVWQRHLRAVQEIARVAPQVQPGTIVVMIGVPKSDDPFGDNYWFDMAVRLLYPRIAVSGVYYFDDGARAPGDNLRLQGSRWEWDGMGAGVLVPSAEVSQTIVIQYNAGDGPSILPVIPSYLCTDACVLDSYRPTTRISSYTATREAWARYGPF